MTRVTVEIELPDTLATQAMRAGLLEPEALARLVRQALLARRVEGLVEARDVLTANPFPPMTPEEVQARSPLTVRKSVVRLVLDTTKPSLASDAARL